VTQFAAIKWVRVRVRVRVRLLKKVYSALLQMQ
jgi:hypothetical protein